MQDTKTHSKVVSIAPKPTMAPNPDLVRMLEGLLGDARSGRVRAMAAVAVYPESRSTMFAGECDVVELLGMAKLLEMRLWAEAAEIDE